MNYKYKITVFTPTYNRKHTLPRLYESLVNQVYKNFEWLIVDDGSTDDTQNIVNDWIKEGEIPIRYYKQDNGGKHRAINKGLDLAQGELFFIVDSDDYLPDNSLEIINSYSNKIDENIVGVAGRKQYSDSTKIGGEFEMKEFVSNHIEKRTLKGAMGDLAEVVKTDVLKQCKFPDFEGERFCAEGLMWNKLAKKGDLYFFDVTVYTAEYLEEGLSSNSIRNRRKSPLYAMQLYSELAQDKRLALKFKIRTYINFWRFSFFSQLSFIEKWKKLNNSFLGLLCLPLGWLMKVKDDKNSNVKITK